MKTIPSLLVLALALLLSGCAGTGAMSNAETRARAARIAAEPPGNYWIGRRYAMPYTHFWGYVRRPGKSWDSARLVIMDEKYKRQPDRLPETYNGSGRIFGFDHNYEYRLEGELNGETGYDPNSNLILPLFLLRNYTLINTEPGYLFVPGERFSPTRLPKPEPQP
jgi:hypothetical protein